MKEKYTFKKFLGQMKSGLFTDNPTFVQLLGMCPTLATTTSVRNAFGMGIAAAAVLVCSNALISLLRRFIPKQIRISAYIVIISGFVTAVEMLIKAYFYDLYGSLGLFIPLIVVNCIILGRAEAFASKNPVLPSVVDGLSMGLGFTFALVSIGAVRELLGTGKLLDRQVFGDWFKPAIIFILPAGAFFTLGFIIAAVQKVRNTISDRERRERLSDISNASDIPANAEYSFVSGKYFPIQPDSSHNPDAANSELDFYPPEETVKDADEKKEEN